MVLKPSKPRPTPKQQPQQPSPSWARHITLDLLLLILANSVFHPWITLVFYLCLAAVHKHREPLAYYTLYYTAFLAIVELAIWLNHRLTYGRHRKVNWAEDNEVVVITGGAQGLGRVLAEMVLRKGAKVAVLDVLPPDEEAQEEMERWDLVWEVVDVSNAEEVKKAVDRVVDELGPPTILVNNAATSINGLPLASPASSDTSTSALSPQQATKTITTNTLGHFTVLSAVLPHLLTSSQGAHIITISSILSHLAPAKLADYSASKAAVSALHNTLCHELRTHPDPSVFDKVKTILVEPGQLSTQLFADITRVPFYAHFFGPVLEAKDVAKEIVRWVERGDGGVIRMPFYAKCVPFLGVMPGAVQRVVRWWSGIDRAIVAREKKV
ncbi:uncharacterized protein Z520_07830 [Fonsecaea multimorphosa CBS 102226]|uniref:NAD(P)-binding protein n=1 Tax=Fonsecaea multimorphosa CBS 102226 TaxID=1442371 RepID=A0A0D2K0R2_9EURO|nr:uncharacterized protein Z520_07830 [Fonsecaea multimorphosa CBS 102226]KIX96564.1 hypothetical protein Z520_07830 [Fonsecaea multimorphosa CBS 102226]OAL22077.1 hypothetical protein AYO22_07437 [Fonsecaea multimorphosa]